MGYKMAIFLTLLISLSLGAFPAKSICQQPEPKTESAYVSYGIVVDDSATLRDQFGSMKEIAKTIIKNKKKGDEAFIVEFNSTNNIELQQEITQDENKLNEVIEGMPNMNGGSSAIIDALTVSSEYLATNGKAGNRRVLILLTDGVEQSNTYKVDQVIQRLNKDRIQLFVLGITGRVEQKYGKNELKKALKLIQTLSEKSGGQAFIADEASELSARTRELSDQLRKN